MKKKNNIPSFLSAGDQRAAADKRTKLYRICNGINTENIKDSRPVTQAQAQQQLKLITATTFTKKLSHLTEIGFRSKTRRMTATNYSTSQVLKEAIIGEYPDYSIDYARVIISSGNLSELFGCVAKIQADGTAVVTWEQLSFQANRESSADLVFMSVYNADRKIFHNYGGAASRGEGVLYATLPEFSVTDTYHCWIFVASTNLRKVSDSKYFNLGSLSI